MTQRSGQRSTPVAPAAAFGVDGDISRRRRPAAGSGRGDGVDRATGRLATRQDGVVERRQLVALGLSAAAIDHRVRAGRLIVIHRGVYAVGHAALTDRGTMRAALMAAGPTAACSHRTAAAVWGLVAAAPPFVEVTVTRRGPRTRAGLVVHSTRRPPEIRMLHALPVTAPLRTLADLAATWPQRSLEEVCAQALVLGLVTQRELEAARTIDPELAAPTRSRFERAFFAALRKSRLPRPLVGHRIAPYTVDFAWPAQFVVLETDGWRFHGHRAAFEDDRARDAHLAAAGWLVVRVTWRQLRDSPMLVMVQLAQTLARRTGTP